MPLSALKPAPAPLATDTLLARYGGKVPRYTSYPAATEFGLAVGPDTLAEWLAAVPTRKPVSLYVHIPFCARLCWFCGCNTRVVNRASVVSDYVEGLRAEAALIEKAAPAGLWANALHLGGGTPNMLSRDDLGELFGLLRHVFRLAPGAEIAAELDPASLTQSWVRAAAFHGLTRASLGVQDLSPQVQAAVNRSEDFDCIARAVTWLREAGVRSVNLDLMYGLPRQTTADVLATLDQVLRLKPDRIALFGYAHVPWMKAHQKLIDAADLPGAAARFDQAMTAEARLVAEGYVALGLDHYALPDDDLAVAAREGRLHRNFQGYTTDGAETLIGLGASAISRFEQGYAQNQSQELEWRRQLSAGRSPVARGLILTEDDRFRGEIIERLMCDFAVDLAAVRARFGRASGALDAEKRRLEVLQRDGLVLVTDDQITVTSPGRPFVRAVCAAFDRYLQVGGPRHSTAI